MRNLLQYMAQSHNGSSIKLLIASMLLHVLACNQPNTSTMPSQHNMDTQTTLNTPLDSQNITDVTDSLRLISVAKARQELDTNGIPDFQRGGYVPGTSERIFHNITPQGYGGLVQNLDRLRRYKQNLGRDRDECLWVAKGEKQDDGTIAPRDAYYQIPRRDDAFRLYLGMPQKHHTWGISDYRPSQSSDMHMIYFSPKYRDNDMRQAMLNEYQYRKTYDPTQIHNNRIVTNERTTCFNIKRRDLEKQGIQRSNPIYAERMEDNPLGDFTMGIGHDDRGDYLYIYDRRDLQPFRVGEGASTNPNNQDIDKQIDRLQRAGYAVDQDTEISDVFKVGKPFEIYDRRYFDPQTGLIIP